MNAEGNLRITSLKDRQFISMLLIDILNYALFSFMFAIFLIYQQITENPVKNFEQIQIEIFVRNLCLFIIGIPFCISCNANLLVSKTFRGEVKKLLLRKRMFCIH